MRNVCPDSGLLTRVRAGVGGMREECVQKPLGICCKSFGCVLGSRESFPSDLGKGYRLGVEARPKQTFR